MTQRKYSEESEDIVARTPVEAITVQSFYSAELLAGVKLYAVRSQVEVLLVLKIEYDDFTLFINNDTILS